MPGVLHELTGEQITAIFGGVVALVLGLAEWARRSANKIVAPVSSSSEGSGVPVYVDPKRADMTIAQLGAVEAALAAHRRVIEDNNHALNRNNDAQDRIIKSFNALHDAVHELRDDMRESRLALKADSDAVRDELKAYRAFKNEPHG